MSDLLASLWQRPADDPVSDLLPNRWDEVFSLRDRLKDYLDRCPRRLHGTIDPAAIVRGEIVSMGPGSVIEAGAVVHESCRLVLGANSRLRSTSLARDEVVVGSDCLIGAYCELARCIVGSRTATGHWVFVGDSVLGANNMLAGAVFIANTTLREGRTIRVSTPEGEIDSGRTHLGMLSGDGVRFGAQVLVSPGTVVHPGLIVPPGSVLQGIVDEGRTRALMAQFRTAWIAPQALEGI